jgi:hypothetical protein
MGKAFSISGVVFGACLIINIFERAQLELFAGTALTTLLTAVLFFSGGLFILLLWFNVIEPWFESRAQAKAYSEGWSYYYDWWWINDLTVVLIWVWSWFIAISLIRDLIW